jgi:tRNA(Ile)-lysidine synthase
MTLLGAVRRFLDETTIAPRGAPILLAVSGGPDSTAMAHALWQLRAVHGWVLQIAVLHHGIRGVVADEDVAHVQRFGAALDLVVHTGFRDVPALAAARRISMETAARAARYEWLARLAEALGAAAVAVGHQRDDQAETVLAHLMRGAGTNGLAGMQALASIPGAPQTRLIRPLLTIGRDEVVAYCREQSLPTRADSTNAALEPVRNRIRLQVLPAMAAINPAVAANIARTAAIVSEEEAFWQEYLALHVDPWIEMAGPGRCELDRHLFRGWHTALQRRAIIRMLARLPGAPPPTFAQIATALRCIQQGQVSDEAPFSQGYHMVLGYDRIVVARSDAMPDVQAWLLVPAGTALPLPDEGLLAVTGTDYVAQVSAAPFDGAVALSLPLDAQVWLRTRHAGDRVHPPGLHGHSQKLKQYLIDRKVPRVVRDRLPVIATAQHVQAILIGHTWHRMAPPAEARQRAAERVRFYGLGPFVDV